MPYVKRSLKIGDRLAVHGKIDFFNGYQIIHPEYDKLDKDEDPLSTGSVIPLYPLTQELKSAGLDNRRLRQMVQQVRQEMPAVPELFPREILSRYDLCSLSDALKNIHFAETVEEVQTAVRRLKFDEHFFLQLLMALRKETLKRESTRAFKEIGPYFTRIIQALDFELTAAQKRVTREIHRDLGQPVVMNRLLQGDVGSGKTIVALLAAAIAIGNGAQVAVMAPTEILAHQHFLSFSKLAESARITCTLLVGNTRTSERTAILDALASGKIQLVVGTHALIQEDVIFKDLGLVIIDEQHRFGVLQRGGLTDKGMNPHILAMTATPIPRTLAMSYHGDMDVSILGELPKNRLPVITRIVLPARLPNVFDFVKKEIRSGRQAMIVYPLVEESEKSDLAAAQEAFETLSRGVFKDVKMGLIHGRLKKEEKDEIMDAFGTNTIQLLVATTVIEVGIDVPNATVMVIEHADRFGLSQLHQLRGRVGRGTDKGYCVLVKRNHTEPASRRLDIMEKTNDGFLIADEDLKIRGPGEFFGIRQSGFLKYKIAHLVQDGPIIRQAREAAFNVVASDKHLRRPEHRTLRERFIKDYQDKLKLVNIA